MDEKMKNALFDLVDKHKNGFDFTGYGNNQSYFMGHHDGTKYAAEDLVSVLARFGIKR